MERNERRRTHYQKLRACGYSPKFATIHKDYDIETINELCRIKKEAKASTDPIDHIVQNRIENLLIKKRKVARTWQNKKKEKYVMLH